VQGLSLPGRLVRVPYIISVFLSFLLFLSHLKRECPQKYLKVLYANTGSTFQPFGNFSQSALVLASLRQAPQIKEGSIKDRPFFCIELSPGFTLITYSIEDGVF
jgi:hypothetical protein